MKTASKLPIEVLTAFNRWNVAINCNRSTDTTNRLMANLTKVSTEHNININDVMAELNKDVFTSL